MRSDSQVRLLGGLCHLVGLVTQKKSRAMAQPAQVKRYRPGKVPEYAREAESRSHRALTFTHQFPEKKLSLPIVAPPPVEVKPSFIVVEDRRLARLQQTQQEVSEDERRRRRVRTVETAEILAEPMVVEETLQTPPPRPRVAAIAEVLIEDTATERRERLRKAKEMIKQEEEEELPVSEEEEEFSDEDSEDEDDESSDEWGFGSRPMIQPRFISKEQRESVKQEEDEEEEERKAQEDKERKLEEQRERVLQQLREFKVREIESADMQKREEIDVRTDDENEEETEREFEMWKLRELQRIKRDREQREAARLEKAQIEARRGMTDEEVIAEKTRLGEYEKEKRQIRFLQKYYHKGAFFADDIGEELKQTHDWLSATGEDAEIDKEVLPSVLQVKNFGRSGRTKYTHLTAEDTSGNAKDSLWSTPMPERLTQSLGGKGSLSRPAAKKRRTDSSQ